MIQDFTYVSRKGRVVFGLHVLARLPDELERLGANRALLLSTPEQTDLIRTAAALCGDRVAATYSEAAMHVPVQIVAEAKTLAADVDADCYVALGGGSTIGLAKALVLWRSAPILAVPTTYAGSEMTTIYGVTDKGEKRTGRDERVVPQTVIYDPSLTYGLPTRLSASSGMNAIAHCVEALYAPDGNPVISLLAEEAISALSHALPAINIDPRDAEARTNALYGAWLAGIALGATSMGLHHKLCHVLGGGWNLPHAETHCAILPHAMRYNATAATDADKRVRRALSSTDAAGGLYDLQKSLGVAVSLEDIGMPKQALSEAAVMTAIAPYANPAPVNVEGVLTLLEAAYRGVRPGGIE